MLKIENSKIFKFLKENNIRLASILEQSFEMASQILDSLPGLYPNYTFHNTQHALRVCRYMEIIAFDNEINKNKISDFSYIELAMIFLSGLLHDIGMYYDINEIDLIKSKKIQM